MSIPTLEEIAEKNAIGKYVEEHYFKEAVRVAKNACTNVQKRFEVGEKQLSDLSLAHVYGTLQRAETDLQRAARRCSGFIDDIACSLVFALHLAVGESNSSQSYAAKIRQHDVFYYAGRHNVEAFHRNKEDINTTGFNELALEYLRRAYSLWKEIKTKKNEAFRYARFAHVCFLLYRLEGREKREENRVDLLKEAIENIKVSQELLHQIRDTRDKDYGKMNEIVGSVLTWAYHRQSEDSWNSAEEEKLVMANKTELEKAFLYYTLKGKVLKEQKPAKFKYREA